MKSHIFSWLALVLGVMSGMFLIEIGKAIGYALPLLMSTCLMASIVLGFAADHFKENR